MKIEKKVADDILEELQELQKLLSERVADLAGVKGGMQARHAYVMYRNLALDAWVKLRDNLKP